MASSERHRMFRSLFQCSKASYTFPIRKQMKANCNSAVRVHRREIEHIKTKEISWECVLPKALQMIHKPWFGFCKAHSMLLTLTLCCSSAGAKQSRTGQVTCNCDYQHWGGTLQTTPPNNRPKHQARPCCHSVSVQPACVECPEPHGTAKATVLEFWERSAVHQQVCLPC